LTEDEVRGTQIFKSKKLPTPRLALNCIGGQNAHEVLRHLAQDGIMVTYGGMSREPLTIPISALIFKVIINYLANCTNIAKDKKYNLYHIYLQNISFKGFWMTAWTQANTESQERDDMFKDLATLFRDKKLQPPPHKLVPFCEYQEAISKALSFDGKTGIKYILDLTKS